MIHLNLEERKKIVVKFFESKYYLDELFIYFKNEILITCTNMLKSDISKNDVTISNFLKIILKDIEFLTIGNLIMNQGKIKLLIQNIENLEIYLKSMAKKNNYYLNFLPLIDNLKESFTVFNGYL